MELFRLQSLQIYNNMNIPDWGPSLEGLDMELAQRIIDFTSGSCFAINGNLQKISSFIFIVTPSSVDISGDLQDILNGAFDVPAIQTDF